MRRTSLAHLPDEAGWAALMQPLHDSLPASRHADGAPDLDLLQPEVALAEFTANGQEGLDGLLAALDGGGASVWLPSDPSFRQ